MADRSKLEIRLDGLKSFKKGLASQGGVAVRNAALAIEAEAKRLAPVDTGALRNSIQATKDPSKPFTWQVAVGASYGIFQEYGTTKTPAHPFLTPAVELVRPQLLAKLKAMMEDPLDATDS